MLIGVVLQAAPTVTRVAASHTTGADDAGPTGDRNQATTTASSKTGGRRLPLRRGLCVMKKSKMRPRKMMMMIHPKKIEQQHKQQQLARKENSIAKQQEVPVVIINYTSQSFGSNEGVGSSARAIDDITPYYSVTKGH
jgi:hypothetical protein